MPFRFRPLILIAFAVCIVLPTSEAQQSSKKKKPAATATKKQQKKPAPSRSRKAESPIAPAPNFTAPRSSAALVGDLGVFLNHTRSGDWGVMITSLTRGDTLFSRNAGQLLRPASTLKLFTAALAFDQLGTEYQFSTDILRDGDISSDGTLRGNLILRGDGDPSLSGRFIDGGPNAPMEILAKQIAMSGIKRITGDIVGDPSAFDDQKIPEGWLSRYLGASYAARVSALSLDDNLVWVAVTPTQPGKPALAMLEPATTTLTLQSSARTIAGSGSTLRMRKFSNGTIEVTGTIGSRSPTKRYSYIVDDPADFATGALKAALQAQGIVVDGKTRLAPTPTHATRVTSLASPALNRLVSAMNRESLNLYAELLFRGASRGPNRTIQGTIATGNQAIRSFFVNIGTDTSGIYHADGSGLSINNRITARAMVQLLAHAHATSWGPAFHASLPVAGKSETLRKRMKGSPAQGNLHAKTGTTNDVVSLAGYVTALNGELLSFAFIYNGTDRWRAKETIDVMGETLANFARD